MIASKDCVCCKCGDGISKGQQVSFLSNKHKVVGEEVCISCIDYAGYKAERLIDNNERE